MARPANNALYDQVLQRVFGGEFGPGSKLIEEDLASELNVSRVPIRETLARLVGQGLLIGGGRGHGVRLRDYTVEEVRQIYEFREVLEGVASAAAARSANTTDLARLEIICEQAGHEEVFTDSRRWPELDYQFHLAMGEASHNSRIAYQLRLLLTECRFLFFIHSHPSHVAQLKLNHEEAAAYLSSVQKDHLDLLTLVTTKDSEQAEQRARADMRKSSERMVRLIVTGSLQVGEG